MFNLLSCLDCTEFELADPDFPLVEQCFLGFLFDFPFNDFLLENFIFSSSVEEFLFHSLVGCEQLLQTVGLSCELFLKLLNPNLWRDGPFFCHGITGR